MNLTYNEFKQLQKNKKNKTTIQTIPESSIQAHIKHYLIVKGWFVFKNHQSLGSHRGVADLYAIKNGINIWVEVKTATGKLSEDQKKFRDDIISCGGNYFVVRSLDDIISITEKYI